MIRPLLCQLLLPLRSCAVSLTSASSLHLTAPSFLTVALHIFIDVVVEVVLSLYRLHKVDKALQSMEEEAERMYRDERGVLLDDDDDASTRDAIYALRFRVYGSGQFWIVTPNFFINPILRTYIYFQVLLSARNGGGRVNFGLYVFFPFYAGLAGVIISC
ncbi:hypothetical protein OROMI_004711 [Orobanche minor]